MTVDMLYNGGIEYVFVHVPKLYFFFYWHTKGILMLSTKVYSKTRQMSYLTEAVKRCNHTQPNVFKFHRQSSRLFASFVNETITQS